jgi:hypothetical protein
MRMGQRRPGRKSKAVRKALRYQRKIIEKECLECGAPTMTQRNVLPVCSATCSDIRRVRLRPQTFKNCESCRSKFGPVNRLSQRFCSYVCKVKAQTTGRKTFRRTITNARNAQRLLRYHIQSGNIVRPSVCDECSATDRKIEGAHFNYDEPLRVRWLCRSCHVRWDKAEPKHGTVIVARWGKFTGKKATLEASSGGTA